MTKLGARHDLLGFACHIILALLGLCSDVATRPSAIMHGVPCARLSRSRASAGPAQTGLGSAHTIWAAFALLTLIKVDSVTLAIMTAEKRNLLEEPLGGGGPRYA
ncbi:hypothetical protein BD779DRAFT_1475529 [Infundibulicybe gibba]|nr:hypothetical protein BD779DRAFT_1475529 [Infundibulicybe gibba]